MKQRISFLLACVFLCLTGCRASGAEQTLGVASRNWM